MARCLQDRHFPEMRQAASDMMIRHLPRLRPEDALWVDREEVRLLLRALDPARPLLTVAILGAMGQVGGTRAIRPVQALCGRVAETVNADEALVRDAAYECLVRLRELAAREKQSSVLLRGSQQPASGAKSELLRAAAVSGPTASAELLRPGNSAARTGLGEG